MYLLYFTYATVVVTLIRPQEMRELLAKGLILQADYDEYRRKEAEDVEQQRIEFEKRLKDRFVPEPKDWYLKFLLRNEKGKVRTRWRLQTKTVIICSTFVVVQCCMLLFS